MKLVSFLALVMGLFIVVGGGLGACGAYRWYAPGPAAAETMVVIGHGQGVAGIAHELADAHVISSALMFRIGVRLTGQQGALKAGEYRFPAAISMAEAAAKMTRGDVFRRDFTVPEGFTSWQARQLIDHIDKLAGALAATPPEGSLLPQTYLYMSGDTKQSAVDQMQKAMTETLDTLWAGRDPDVPLATPRDAVTLASIVEKETGVPTERARIAGLFENRLKAHIALQSDPTVIYALTQGHIQTGGMGPLGRRLLGKDLEIDSPYNTYKYPGLPPGPIANPGKDALTAVLHPEHNDYLYFVADGTGGHVFAKTLDEHNANVAKWRTIRKEENR
jgi:UPF0755 protein